MKKIAVLIDCDNMSINTIHLCLEKVKQYGQIIIKRIYCDFSSAKFNNSDFKSKVENLGLQTIQAFSYVNKKNTSDLYLIIDAMDLLTTNPSVDRFCIISSDSDFIPLVQKIKEKGKTTIGIGRNKSVSKAVENVYDEFIDISSIENEYRINQRLLQRIDIAYELTKMKSKSNNLSIFYENLKLICPEFDLKEYNCKNISTFFKKFLSNYYELKFLSDTLVGVYKLEK
ncbi:MAG: NYN domain-containing protein [Candidatus Sericytochromatia bacterium]